MSYFGLHLQTPVDGWTEEIRRAAAAAKPYRLVKSLWVEAGQVVKSLSPTTTTVFRHNVEHKQPFLDRAILSTAEADAAADEFILQFKDSVNQHGHLDYVESLNETYASEDRLGQEKAVSFDRAFIRRLKIHCPNTKPVVYTAASGNIDHDEYNILIPLASECASAKGAFGYHNYWSVVNGNSYVNSSEHARDYHMRWAWSLDSFLTARGIRVNWMLGESGPIGAGPNGYWQRPDDGWLHNEVWNGNISGYLSDLERMDHLFKNTHAHYQGRLLGAALFTSGVGVGWQYFQLQHSALIAVTNYVISSTAPPQPPQPPSSEFRNEAWRVTVEMQEKGQNGIRLNALAGIQQAISAENEDNPRLQLQIVTSETIVNGKTIQAVESLTGLVPRRVYVWEAGKEVYFFESP